MDQNSRYFKQVELLVQVLPAIANYSCLALKGGTAINLFVRNLPRLSVDIDLTYVPVNQRNVALSEIHAAFSGLKNDLEKLLPGVHVVGSVLAGTNYLYKLVAQLETIQVKIEISPVMRGVVDQPVQMETSSQTQETFGYASVPVLAFTDLYAGKMCAALDRQHPRDLFDVSVLLQNEGIGDKLLDVFLIYLVCGNRPIAELLAPVEHDIEGPSFREFQGMTNETVTLNRLNKARRSLITEINEKLTSKHKQFLLSFKQGEPDWGLLNTSNVELLPAVQWKLHNIRKMPKNKHQIALNKLKQVLYG